MIAAQLYTVRDAVSADLDMALDRLAQIGLRYVELYGFESRAAQFAAAMRKSGLRAVSAHASLVDRSDEDLKSLFEDAATLGVPCLVEPSVGRARWRSHEQVHATADRLGEVAEQAESFGLQVGYHNHEWEFQEVVEAEAAYQVFLRALPPSVLLEVDTYWVAVAGHDPAALLESLGTRAGLIHLKDGPVNRETAAQVPLGDGAMDVPAILGATRAVRVLELDDYRGDIFDALAGGHRYLLERGEQP